MLLRLSSAHPGPGMDPSATPPKPHMTQHGPSRLYPSLTPPSPTPVSIYQLYLWYSWDIIGF